MKAAGINFADLMARVGLYPDAPPIPCVVGYEVAGVLDQVGPGVEGFAVGDRVFGTPASSAGTPTPSRSAEQVFHMPEKMSFEEGAALPVVYLTAYTMMMFTGNLRRGFQRADHSAAGGVGIAAIQLARTRDCVIFGRASKGKHEYLRSIGVQHCIDNDEDYVAACRRVVGDKGIDLVLDPVGGKSWREGYDLLGPCGGASSGSGCRRRRAARRATCSTRSAR